MRSNRGGGWRSALILAGTLVLACGSHSSASSTGLGGASNTDAGAGASEAESGSNAGGTRSGLGSAGHGGGTPQAHGGASSAGDASGAGDASSIGGTSNVFVEQIVASQGGGPSHCLPRALPIGEPDTANDGRISCTIGEFKVGSCDCSQPARAPLAGPMLTAMKKALQQNGSCAGNSGVACDTFCGCELTQAAGTAHDQSSALYACQNEVTVAAGVNGFCVVDADPNGALGALPLGNPDIVAECPSNEKRVLRFVGAGEPSSGAELFLGCAGVPLSSELQ